MALPDAKLTVEFNCKALEEEEVRGDATMGHLAVHVPIGNQTPLTLNFQKDCQVPQVQKISVFEKFVQLLGGREPVPLEGTQFNLMVEWVRLFIVALGIFGLFCAIFMISFDGQRQNRPKESANQAATKKANGQPLSQEAINIRGTLRTLIKSLSLNGCPRHDERVKLLGRREIKYLQETADQESNSETKSLLENERSGARESNDDTEQIFTASSLSTASYQSQTD